MYTFKAMNGRKIIRLIISIALPLLVGGLAAFITRGRTEAINALFLPPLYPPAAVFPIVWSILYILMGIAAFLIYEKGFVKDYVRDALKYYGIQLVFNFLWPIVFFRFGNIFAAIWVLLALWIFVGICAAKFYRIRHSSGILMLIYFLWCTFALYLNIGVWLLN